MCLTNSCLVFWSTQYVQTTFTHGHLSCFHCLAILKNSTMCSHAWLLCMYLVSVPLSMLVYMITLCLKLFFVCFLATPCNLWNLSSLTRDWTQAFSSESTWSPNHCTTWKFPKFKFLRNFQTRFSKALYHLILPLIVYKGSNFPTSVSNFLLAFAIICHILLTFSWVQIESLWVWLAFP